MSQETMDWKKLSAVNLSEIKNTKNHPAIQENLSNILNCDPVGEFNMSQVDPNFHKLFSLSQLTIKSLMDSQSYLSGVIVAMGDKLSSSQQREKEKESEKQEAVERADRYKKKCLVLNKMMQVQREMISQDNNGEARCQFCPKSFVSLDFMINHMRKRHPDDLQRFNPHLVLSNRNHGVAASEVVQQNLGDLRSKINGCSPHKSGTNIYEILSELKEDILKKVEDKFSGDHFNNELHKKVESLKSSIHSRLKDLSENQDNLISRVECLSKRGGNIGELETEPSEEVVRRLSEDYESRIHSKDAQMKLVVEENGVYWRELLDKQERDHEVRVEELVSIITELRVQIQRLESQIGGGTKRVRTNNAEVPKEVEPKTVTTVGVNAEPRLLKSPPLDKGIEYYRRKSVRSLDKGLRNIGIEPQSTCQLSEAEYIISMDRIQQRSMNRRDAFFNCRQRVMVDLERRMDVSSSVSIISST